MRVRCPVLCLCTALPLPAQGGLVHWGLRKHAGTLQEFLPIVEDFATFATFATFVVVLLTVYLHIWCALNHFRLRL